MTAAPAAIAQSLGLCRPGLYPRRAVLPAPPKNKCIGPPPWPYYKNDLNNALPHHAYAWYIHATWMACIKYLRKRFARKSSGFYSRNATPSCMFVNWPGAVNSTRPRYGRIWPN